MCNDQKKSRTTTEASEEGEKEREKEREQEREKEGESSDSKRTLVGKVVRIDALSCLVIKEKKLVRVSVFFLIFLIFLSFCDSIVAVCWMTSLHFDLKTID